MDGVTFVDWVKHSTDDVRRDGFDGAKRAAKELWYGARARVRSFHWVTPDSRTISVGDITVEMQQKYVGEFDQIRAHHNEAWLANDLVEELDSDDFFWDIGGNAGLYTLLAAECGADVVTFEPWLENAATIERNLRRNDLSARIIPKALAGEGGPREFTLDERETPGSGRGSLRDDWQDGRTQTVECIRGDMAIERDGLPSPTVAKIDVEGAELEVLEGFGDYLSDIQTLYCELHGFDDSAVRSLLRDQGFEIDADTDKTQCGILRARNTNRT